MEIKKVVGFIMVIFIMICIIPITVTASTGYELGEFTIISDNNQQNGWCTNGVDGIETGLYIRAFNRVTDLFFELDTEVDNLTLVCFGDGNGWTWTETPIEVNGTWFSVDVKDINGWSEIMTGNDVKILLCNYNPSWENIKIKGFTGMPGGPFPDEEAWVPKNFIINSDKAIITAVDFNSDNFEEHGSEYARYTIRPEMAALKGPQTEVGWSGLGDNICCIDAGEWVQYTIEVTEAGEYNIAAWIASDADNSGIIEVYIDDILVGASAETISNKYDLYPVGTISLTKGTHIIKTVFPKGGITFSALELTYNTNLIHSAQTDDIGIINYILILLSSGIIFELVRIVNKKVGTPNKHNQR